MGNKSKQSFQGRTNPSQNPARTERTERSNTPAQRAVPTRKS